ECAQHRREQIVLERVEVVRVFRSHDRELALQTAHAPREVRGELPVPASRSVRALPPGVADGSHDLAGAREEPRDLREAERWLLLSRVVLHRAIVRTCGARLADRSRSSSTTSVAAIYHFLAVSSLRRGTWPVAPRSDRGAAGTMASLAAE